MEGAVHCSVLFADVHYVLINPPDDDHEFTELIEELDHNGAHQIPLDSNNRIANLKDVSHIITTTVDFSDYVRALEDLIPIVKPTWIRNSLAKGKQQNPRSYSPDPALFLSDVVLHCADVPDGDREAIIGGVLAMGGLYSENLSKLCTHLVALSEDDPKVVAVLSKKLSCKVVLPHWFDDCLRLRRRISEEDYRLPDPKILRKDLEGVPPTPRNNPDIFNAMHLKPQSGVPEAKPTNVFKGRSVYLSDDLELPAGIRQSICEIISNGGGKTTEVFNKADIFVCQYREDDNFAQAWMDQKDIGNLNWLYHIITHDRWINPMLRLLHFPLPKHGIPGFEDYIVTVSNYTGHARVYLESLLKASGARYTKTMTNQNSHLIAAHTQSEKCAAAREWSVEVVNHLWLEDSFAQNRSVAMTIGRYTHFPGRTNLGEVVGQTPVDSQAIHKFWIQPWIESLNPQPPLVSPMKKAKSSRKTTSDLLPEAQDDEQIGSGRAARNRHSTSLATPRPGKENRHPSNEAETIYDSAGGRRAKTRALSMLHDAAMDIELYNKERKRVGGVTHGRNRQTTSATAEDSGKDSPKRKREEDEDEVTSEEEEGKTKRARTGPRLKLMVTLYEKWQGNASLEQTDKNKLRNLGIQLLEGPVTSPFILCAPRIARTKKFICALAYAPDIVSTSFLDHVLETKDVPSADELSKFRLVDKVGEGSFLKGSTLQDAIRLARLNKRKLLKDWQIFCTPTIQNGTEIYKEIIEVNGGRFFEFKDRMKMTVSKRGGRGNTQSQADDEPEKLFLVSGGGKTCEKLWKGFREMARSAKMEPVIVGPEWLLNVVLGQDVDQWREEWRFG